MEATERFVINRQLGVGGMGVVYEAYDRQLDSPVALKTLRRLNPDALFLFKHEFRALADVTHRNLVTLYELLVADGEWFFTMELVDGVDILSYLRGEPGRAVADSPDSSEQPTASSGSDQTSPTRVTVPRSSAAGEPSAAPVDAARLRPILTQLVEAVAALHATGHLHCDLKPSNVLVDRDGRVVVLDYGVITEMTSPDANSSTDQFRGTPTYAAPEQVSGAAPASPATDWYSVGVILFQALTGRRPFSGSVQQVVAAKQSEAAPRPEEIRPDVDPVLAALCTRLLALDPEARPTGAEILAAIDARSAPAPAIVVAPDPGNLVGRDRELIALREAFDRSRQGYGVAVRVKGRSGMGKTTLVTHFLDSIRERDQALVLTGRCYERETVPHQAVDGLVDSLSRYLLDLPRADADALMPLDVQAMARAFPVLARVEAVAHARRRSARAVADPVELRQRAYAALHELFARIAERQPLVLSIDDLQWGDVDSAPFLADLLRPPAPPLLLVVSYRSEERATSALLRTLLGDKRDGPLAGARSISVGRLSLPQARDLAQALLREVGVPITTAEKIARESGGNPFFVHELVRWVSENQVAAAAGVPVLAKVLLARTSALSVDAQELLRVVAVAGKPIADETARRATDIGEHYPRALAELRTAHLVRTGGADAGLVIETFHDRIRESLIESMGEPVLVSTHLRIAESMEIAERPDLEALAIHYQAAGELVHAGEYAERAADRAADALAFEQATDLYRLALELAGAEDKPRRASLGRRLGDALVNAGRGSEAPEVYLAAAADAGPSEALDLKVRAGSELLRSGQVEAGVEVLRPALDSAGIALARGKGRAALSLLLGRAYVRLRGLRFTPRTEQQITPELRTVIDACLAAAAGLAMVDPLRGAYLQTRHLLVALRHGDRFRVGRALTWEGGFLSINGRPMKRRVDRIIGLASDLAAEIDEPYLNAMIHTHSALAEYQRGVWSEARDHARVAETIYRDRCAGVGWELANTQQYRIWALYWLGEFVEMAECRRAALRDAHSRGDLYATVSLRGGLPSFAGLAADDADGTRRRASSAAEQWPQVDYTLQHFWTAVALTQCDLYVGDAVAAAERAEAQWPLLRGSFLLRVVMVRAETLLLRARCALAAAAVTDQPAEYVARARQLARQLARQPMDWCGGAAALVEAGVAQLQGQTEVAVARLEVAEHDLHATETHGLAWAAARRRGVLVGGDEGRDLIQDSDARMRAQKVVNPERMTRFFAPGLDPTT